MNDPQTARNLWDVIAQLPEPFTTTEIHRALRGQDRSGWSDPTTAVWMMRIFGLIKCVHRDLPTKPMQMVRTQSFHSDSIPNIFKHSSDFRISASETHVRTTTR